MSQQYSFGYWLKRSRKALDMTQVELANQVGCSAETIRKIEAEERRPSAQIVDRLAAIFDIPKNERKEFLQFARGDRRSAPHTITKDVPWHVSVPHLNLPASLPTLIGREQDIVTVYDYLSRHNIRLVTLIGPPGIGKTRLSIEAARKSQSDFPDGVFFVALAPVDEPSLIPLTILQALGYVEAKKVSASQQLIDGLREKQILLVLDNCEHLIEDIASLASDLLSACSRLKILATSRESLRISGEWLYRVPALGVPKGSLSVDIETASKFPALTLFTERAHAVHSDFALDASNIQAIAFICAQLDGLPLAIELIAARSRFMTPESLMARLNDQLTLHADGVRAVSSRQKTLHDAIAWSYNLLSAEEQNLFARLSVFSGGFTLGVAEAMFSRTVMGESVSDLIVSLLDKSLLQHIPEREAQGEPRFNMLVTIRQFALERLRDMGLEKNERDRHLEYFQRLAEQAKPHLQSAQQLLWMDRLETEYDNIRSALTWAQDSGASIAGLHLAADLQTFWIYRAFFREPCLALENLLAKSPPVDELQVFVKAHIVAGVLHMFLGNYASGRAHAQESERLCLLLGPTSRADLAHSRNILIYTNMDVANDPIRAREGFEENLKLFQGTEDQWGMAHTLYNIGLELRRNGDFTGARQAHQQSLALFQECGDQIRVTEQNSALAMIAFEEGKYTEARIRFEKVLSFYRQVRFNLQIDFPLYMLGAVAIREGDYARAKAWYLQCLLFDQQIGRYFQLAECLIGFASIAKAEERFERAAQLMGAAELEIEVRQTPPEKFDQAELQRLATILRKELSDADFELHVAEGRAMTMEQAIAYALEEASS